MRFCFVVEKTVEAERRLNSGDFRKNFCFAISPGISRNEDRLRPPARWQALVTQAQIDAAADMAGATRHATAVNGFPRAATRIGCMLRTNPRLALAFVDLGGFDTLANETGILERGLAGLSQGIVALKAAPGAAEWRRTRVAVLTGFGRTVRGNGTRGTDHGHGGLFLPAGAVADGRMPGDFSGLARAADSGVRLHLRYGPSTGYFPAVRHNCSLYKQEFADGVAAGGVPTALLS